MPIIHAASPDLHVPFNRPGLCPRAAVFSFRLAGLLEASSCNTAPSAIPSHLHRLPDEPCRRDWHALEGVEVSPIDRSSGPARQQTPGPDRQREAELDSPAFQCIPALTRLVSCRRGPRWRTCAFRIVSTCPPPEAHPVLRAEEPDPRIPQPLNGQRGGRPMACTNCCSGDRSE